MVVHYIEQHHQPQLVGAVDQRLQFVWRAISRAGGEWQHAVITPIAFAGKSVHGHELDGSHAQLGQAWQLLHDTAEAVEHSHMQFINNGFAPKPTLPT